MPSPTLVSKEELFGKYNLSFQTLSRYITATYDPAVMANLDFAAVRDSLSDGQTASKLWVVDLMKQFLSPESKTIAVFGGWVGILPRLLLDFNAAKTIHNIEIDSTLRKVNEILLGEYPGRAQFIHCDMYDFDYQNFAFDVYINTSGEHIPSLKEWIEKIPAGKTIIIQSNDFTAHEQHINCVTSAEELEQKVLLADNVKDVIYRGAMKLPIYTRFMVVAKT